MPKINKILKLSKALMYGMCCALACSGQSVQAQTRMYALNVSPQFETMISKYTGILKLSVQMPIQDSQIDRVVVYAYSQKQPEVAIIYTASGWIPMSQCGIRYDELLASCSLPARGQQVVLSDQLTNGQLADLDVVVRYAVGKGNQLVEAGYTYQCTRFGSFPFCLTL